MDYQDFRNPQIEEEDNWEELYNEKKEEVDEEEKEEIDEEESMVFDNPFKETMRSGGLVSRFFTISMAAPIYVNIIDVITDIKSKSQQCYIKDAW